VTETNSTIDMDTQPAALFGADMYMTWLENGVSNVDWWERAQRAGTISTVNGVNRTTGDQGILSNGSSSSWHHRASGRDAVRALLRPSKCDQARLHPEPRWWTSDLKQCGWYGCTRSGPPTGASTS